MNIWKTGRYFLARHFALCFLPYSIEIILPEDYCKQIGNKYIVKFNLNFSLSLSWRRSLSYRNQSIGSLPKSMDWFLYDNGLRHERVKKNIFISSDFIRPHITNQKSIYIFSIFLLATVAADGCFTVNYRWILRS